MIVYTIALTLFLVANPIGNTPVCLALVKDFSPPEQRRILMREGLFSMLIAYAFLFLGEPFLQAIQIEQYALRISGGLLLFVVAMNMIFPPPAGAAGETRPVEPFIVPIATPLISGGGIFATIIIYAKQNISLATISLGIFLAWAGILLILASASYLRDILGKRGLIAMEQLMGMILAMLSLEIVVAGLHEFVQQA